jgi:IS4 transposase
MTIATTLTDATLYTKEDIAELYGFRWNSELDLRSIKQSLNLATSAANPQRWFARNCGPHYWHTI